MEENNENQVTEPSEESNAKTYTEAEVEELKNQLKSDYEKSFDDKFNKRWGREMSKQQRSQAKTNELLDLLKKETGKDNIDDLLELSYKQYGVEKPNNDSLSDDDYKILGKKDAKAILDLDDYEEIKEEAERLSYITDRTPREQATFMELASYLTTKKAEQKRIKEIEESGIDKEVLEDADFKTLLSKFRDDTPIKDVFEVYEKTRPKKEKPFTTGSLKGTNVEDKNKVKEYYSEDEARQFTRKDYDNNPALWEAIQRSMPKWYSKK